MFESFLYKKLNIFLLLLMCVVVVALAGTSIFFQESFRGLNDQYQETSQNYTTTFQKLTRCQNTLAEKAEKLNSTSLDIRKYDELYSQKVTDLDKTKNELLATDAELKETQAQKAKVEQQYQAALIEQQRLKQQIGELQGTVSALQRQIEQLKVQLDACKSS